MFVSVDLDESIAGSLTSFMQSCAVEQYVSNGEYQVSGAVFVAQWPLPYRSAERVCDSRAASVLRTTRWSVLLSGFLTLSVPM